VMAGVVGLVYWCHRWLETGSMPTPRTMAIRQSGVSARPRSLREKIEARPTLANIAHFHKDGRVHVRTRPTGSYPQQAA